MKVTKLLIFCLFILVASLAEASKIPLIPNAFLIIPEGSIVKVEWIVIPQSKERLPNANSIRLIVNSKREPLIIFDKKVIFNPVVEYVLILSDTAKDLICLENGVPIISDGTKIGYILVDTDKNSLPIGKFIPIANLPVKDAKIFAGSETVYALSWNGKNRESEIFLFDRVKKVFRKVLSFPERIESLSGREDRIFFVSGKTIWEYKNGKFFFIYEHPSQKIEEIFFNEKAGLIYKTSKGVGIVKDGSALEFLQAESLSIYLKGTSLFVLFSSHSGVLEIKNIDDLKNYSFKIENLLDVKESL